MQTTSNHRAPQHSHPSDAGFSLVETMVASVLFLGVLLVTFSTVIGVTQANNRSREYLAEENSSRELLDEVVSELQRSTTGVDPVTAQPRFRTDTVSGSLRRRYRLQVLDAAAASGGEVQPTWSSDILYELDDQGRLARIQDGERRLISRGVEDFTIEPLSSGRFKVTAKVRRRDPRSGQIEVITHERMVLPWN